MSDLLDDVLGAHGGLKRWQQVRTVSTGEKWCRAPRITVRWRRPIPNPC